MHDIDRVRLEAESETGMYETGPFESEYFEFRDTEAFYPGEAESVFSETQEMEMASEMLEIMSEAELDRFLGNLINRAGGAIGRFVSSPAGQAIGGILKGAAKQVLPSLGSAIGGYFGGADGAQLGSQAASAAGRLFGLELEGLSAEDREFEVARRYVRFAGDAVKNLALDQTSQDPRVAANTAAVTSAQTLAPGLLQTESGALTAPSSIRGAIDAGVRVIESRARPTPTVSVVSGLPSGHSGRWVRHGNKIVLYGI